MAYSPDNNNKLDTVILVDLDQSTANEVMEAGKTVRAENGNEYKFVKYECSAVAAVSGAPAILSSDTGTPTVTSDTSDGDADGGSGYGAFCSDQANGNGIYLWIQTKGEVADASVDTGVAAGDLLYVGQSDVFAAVEDDFDSTSNTQYKPIARALEAASGTGTSKADIVLL